MRWSSSPLVRLVAPYLIALGAVALTLYAYSEAVVDRLYLQTLSDGAIRQAKLLAPQIPWDEHGAPLDARCAALTAALEARLSVIDADGTVLCDSAARSEALQNQRESGEVRGALQSGSAADMRLNAATGETLYHVAWRESRGTRHRIMRLSFSSVRADAARFRIRAAIWTGLALAALLALGPGVWLGRRFGARVRAMTDFSSAVSEGRKVRRLAPGGDDVLGLLEANLSAMADNLRQRLEVARQEKGKLEATLSGMVEAVVVLDADGIIQLFNQRAERLLGAGLRQGSALIEVTRDPDLHDLVRAAMQARDDAVHTRDISLEIGSRRFLQVTVSPIAAAPGELRQFLLVFHDITDLKKLEATRRDFVANVSHELRTPLTAIRGYAETLLNGAVDDPQVARKFLSVIERHSERLTRLTDDLLTLSDLELGRAALQRDAITLAPCVEAAVEVVREKARARNVTLQAQVPQQFPLLYADADRLEQVLVNLLDNAVKYTAAGGSVTASARLLPSDDHGTPSAQAGEGWVEICVSDTGAGIPRQDLPRLTERFYRVDKARSRALGGTGLGLAIVKHIVQAHGGSLDISSEVGKGTNVYVRLPFASPPLGEA